MDVCPTCGLIAYSWDGSHACRAKPAQPPQSEPFGLPVDDEFLKSRVDDSWKAGLIAQSEPKSYWVLVDKDGYVETADDRKSVFDDCPPEFVIHVIEHSAYAQVVRELETRKRIASEYIAENEKQRERIVELSTQNKASGIYIADQRDRIQELEAKLKSVLPCFCKGIR